MEANHSYPKDLCREVLPWRQLRHPRIVPFLGLDRDTRAPHLCMVSPCMSGGSLLEYIKKFVAEVDVVNLVRFCLLAVLECEVYRRSSAHRHDRGSLLPP